MGKKDDNLELLKVMGGKDPPAPEEFKRLVSSIDSHSVLAKIFLLEGVPHVFKDTPMKYMIFREQVADRFDVGSQDVCIVGSAKLGFSPSSHKYGTPFHEDSDVDVVVISEPLFYRGSRELFATVNDLDPPLHKIRPFLRSPEVENAPVVPLVNWRRAKDVVRNFVYENLNPG